jgi:endonuclease III
MIKCQWRRLKKLSLWFITNEIKGNPWVITYLDRQAWWKSTQSFEFLEELPAVGHKTGVVMSQALVLLFPVDTHIHRLMYR